MSRSKKTPKGKPLNEDRIAKVKPLKAVARSTEI